MDNFCDIVKNMIKPGSQGHLFCSLLQSFVMLRERKSFIAEKEVVNDRKEVEVDVLQEKVFEVE